MIKRISIVAICIAIWLVGITVYAQGPWEETTIDIGDVLDVEANQILGSRGIALIQKTGAISISKISYPYTPKVAIIGEDTEILIASDNKLSLISLLSNTIQTIPYGYTSNPTPEEIAVPLSGDFDHTTGTYYIGGQGTYNGYPDGGWFFKIPEIDNTNTFTLETIFNAFFYGRVRQVVAYNGNVGAILAPAASPVSIDGIFCNTGVYGNAGYSDIPLSIGKSPFGLLLGTTNMVQGPQIGNSFAQYNVCEGQDQYWASWLNGIKPKNVYDVKGNESLYAIKYRTGNFLLFHKDYPQSIEVPFTQIQGLFSIENNIYIVSGNKLYKNDNQSVGFKSIVVYPKPEYISLYTKNHLTFEGDNFNLVQYATMELEESGNLMLWDFSNNTGTLGITPTLSITIEVSDWFIKNSITSTIHFVSNGMGINNPFSSCIGCVILKWPEPIIYNAERLYFSNWGETLKLTTIGGKANQYVAISKDGYDYDIQLPKLDTAYPYFQDDRQLSSQWRNMYLPFGEYNLKIIITDTLGILSSNSVTFSFKTWEAYSYPTLTRSIFTDSVLVLTGTGLSRIGILSVDNTTLQPTQFKWNGPGKYIYQKPEEGLSTETISFTIPFTNVGIYPWLYQNPDGTIITGTFEITQSIPIVEDPKIKYFLPLISKN